MISLLKHLYFKI